jgi:hypothetical protein
LWQAHDNYQAGKRGTTSAIQSLRAARKRSIIGATRAASKPPSSGGENDHRFAPDTLAVILILAMVTNVKAAGARSP